MSGKCIITTPQDNQSTIKCF